jgi:tetratricopeptide (TPR) repeat protein
MTSAGAGGGTYDHVVDAETFDEARWALLDEPYGTARSARTESLLAAAERIGSTPLIARALIETVVAYNYGGESAKSTVSMSRLLRLFDQQPGEFDEALTHSVFWHLKWVTDSLLAVPDLPLRTVRAFLEDMERRFRTAGHSMRAVHKCRFFLAEHTGDRVAAAREFEAWLAADRDSLTDCDACERRAQGRWLIEQQDDARALEIFEPTLSSMRSCAEEPQLTIADSLIPLLRLGRLDEARHNHMRGYPMVRGKVSTYASVGKHVEFCALTGNEGRGIEITAEHRAWLTEPADDATAHLSFLGGVAVLLGRLVDIGRGDVPVAAVPGTDGTAAGLHAAVTRELTALAARFDARNGSDHVSRLLGERLAQRPFTDALPLGVRSVLRPAAAAPVARPAAGPEPTATAEELLRRARELDDSGHPAAASAWEQFAAAVEGHGDEVTGLPAAELASSRAIELLNSGEIGAGLLELKAAAEGFDRHGAPGRASVARARTAFAVLHPQAPVTIAMALAEDLDEVTDTVHGLIDAAQATGADLVAVLACRAAAARLRLMTAEDAAAAQAARTDTETELARLHKAAERHGLLHRVAEAAEFRAQLAMMDGDHDAARAALRLAVDRWVAAERPWHAVQPARVLGNVLLHDGYPQSAEAVFLEVHDTARDIPELRAEYAEVLIGLTNAAAATGRPEAATEYALHAADEHDRLGDRVGAAQCRQGLAALLMDGDRPAHAVAVLAETLPEIDELLDEDAGLRARQLLGSGLLRTGQAEEAARVLAEAAGRAAGGADRVLYADLAAETGQALSACGKRAEADAAFGTAVDLMRDQNRPGAVVRLLRASAWNLLGAGDEDDSAADRALARFADAFAALDTADSSGTASPDLDSEHERVQTELQLCHALWQLDRDDEALRLADRVGARLEVGLPNRQAEYAELVSVAARVEAYVHEMPELARSRIDAALPICRMLGAEEAAQRLTALREELA